MTGSVPTLSLVDYHISQRRLLSLVFILFIALLMTFVYIPATGEDTWRMKVHYSLLDQTICADYIFDTLDSCEKSRDWFIMTV